MIIRKTEAKDLNEISKIYSKAKEFMRLNGNPNQWKGDYPNAFDAEEDIKNGIGYVCEDEGEIVGVFAFKIGIEPTYNKIFGGKWLNDLPYAFVHRIAVSSHGKGIVDFCFNECFKRFPNLKIDTHRDNIPMQKVLIRNGFSYCGIIYLGSGEERLAFHKTSN
ncbi:MAG: GNAT family N-acetyltransferase [Clostridia bacterium]|nr:GNAT family N-acetyltransferase [Clostridia bacterium]